MYKFDSIWLVSIFFLLHWSSQLILINRIIVFNEFSLYFLLHHNSRMEYLFYDCWSCSVSKLINTIHVLTFYHWFIFTTVRPLVPSPWLYTFWLDDILQWIQNVHHHQSVMAIYLHNFPLFHFMDTFFLTTASLTTTWSEYRIIMAQKIHETQL